MNKTIMIDSQIFVWGIKGHCTPGQEHYVSKAKPFIQWLEEQEYKILLPVPQIAELLSYLPPEKHHEVSVFFDKRFRIAPFDHLAASKCAELIHKSLKEPEIVQYRQQQSVPKNKIKFDCMLAAIAITRNADRIYSEDRDLLMFADKQIDVVGIPTVGVQSKIHFGGSAEAEITT